MAAEDEVHVCLLTRPQPAIEQPVDPLAYPPGVKEDGARLAGVGLVR